MRSAKKALAAFVASHDVDEIPDGTTSPPCGTGLQDDIEYFAC
jgi:hypothetical protein